MKKRKQHYVWKYYLKSWSSVEQIFCLRDRSIFKSNLIGVANERDFYNFKELNEADIYFVRKFVTDNVAPSLQKNNLGILDIFTLISEINKINSNGEFDEFIHNFEEDFHGKVEIDSIEYIDLIKDKNIDFYKNKDRRDDFLYFLCIQCFRTIKFKNMWTNFSPGISDSLCVHFKKTHNIISHIFALNLACNMAVDPSFKILLILNDSTIPFVTGDQPIVNTFITTNLPNKIVDDLELYYPVSPRTAILVTNKKEYANIDNLYINESNTIHDYNSLIIRASYAQIYSDSKELLESYKFQKT